MCSGISSKPGFIPWQTAPSSLPHKTKFIILKLYTFYTSFTELIKRFLAEFHVVDEKGSKLFVYATQLIKLAHREQVDITIDLDHLGKNTVIKDLCMKAIWMAILFRSMNDNWKYFKIQKEVQFFYNKIFFRGFLHFPDLSIFWIGDDDTFISIIYNLSTSLPTLLFLLTFFLPKLSYYSF